MFFLGEGNDKSERVEAFFGITAELGDCFQFFHSKPFGMTYHVCHQDHDHWNKCKANESQYWSVYESKNHSSGETTDALEELTLTITKPLADGGEVLSDVAWHLFHIVLFEEGHFLSEQTPEVQTSQLDCELFGGLLHQSVIQVRDNPDDGSDC